MEKLREKMNYYKNVGMIDPFKELSFFISPGLKYLDMKFMNMRKQNEGIIFIIINWLHSNTSIKVYTQVLYI